MLSILKIQGSKGKISAKNLRKKILLSQPNFERLKKKKDYKKNVDLCFSIKISGKRRKII